MKMDIPGFITELDTNEVFVFGSNLAGRHGAGAAKHAADMFGAEYGIGEGLVGQSYAFPTLDWELRKLTPRRLEVARNTFYAVASQHNRWWFYLTKVGCGLAGYPEDQMRDLFRSPPVNVIKPTGW